MNRLHFELTCGAAGDMILGALVDCGADYEYIVSTLKQLDISDWDIEISGAIRAGITAKNIVVTDNTGHNHNHNHNHEHEHDHDHDHSTGHTHTHKAHRHLSDMLKVLDNPVLSKYVKEKAEEVFNLLAEAEGAVHGQPKEKVHFHEISGIDTLIDVIGSALAIENLGVEYITAGKVAVGSGTIKCAHGVMPVPAPATLKIIEKMGISIVPGLIDTELLTPTGAAILGVFCEDYGKFSGGKIVSIGYGAGDKDFDATANAVRAIVYEEESASQIRSNDIIEIRFAVDDATGEELGFLQEKLYSAGILESYMIPTVMKKFRGGYEVVVLLNIVDREKIEKIIFMSGITLGMRVREVSRSVLERTVEVVDVLGNPIKVKSGLYKGHVVSLKAEYDDCKRVAEETGREFSEIKRLAETRI